MSTPRAREFWRRMAERIGQRWYDDFGTHPNSEWGALVAGYSDAVLSRFFDSMPAYAHPPTHAMVAHELQMIARKGADDATDYVRTYWRSCVQQDLQSMGALLGLWPRGSLLQALPMEIRGRVLRFANGLVEELYTSEKTIGTRNTSMMEHCGASCWAFLQHLHIEQQRPPQVMARGAA